MRVTRLTPRDLNEMVSRAVRAVLDESVREVMGSAMADKEDVIDDIINYVKDEWKRIQEDGDDPVATDTFVITPAGPEAKATMNAYNVILPDGLTSRLGLADKFDLGVQILDYNFDPKYLKYMGDNERSTEGRSLAGGGIFDRFNKVTRKMMRGRIELFVPSILGELQTQDLRPTLYHELNHSFSGLQIKRRMSVRADGTERPDDELDSLNLSTMSRRKDFPHDQVQNSMSDDDDIEVLLRHLAYGDDEDEFRAMNFILYSIWETTERNARAESIYGSLKELGATRGNFRDLYPKTAVARNIKSLSKLLDQVNEVPATSNIWRYAARVLNMRPRGNNKRASRGFFEDVKRRFIARSRELLDVLYRKAMKVAELYFQSAEPKKGPSRLERYKREHNK